MVLDNHPVFRLGLTQLLRDEPDLEVVWAGGDPAEALEQISARRPAVLVLDYRLPGMSGPEVIREARQRLPDLQILALSSHQDEVAVRSMLQAGASGYLLKESEPSVILHAIRTVASGEAVLDPAIADIVLRWIHDHSPEGIVRRPDGLTAREIEVVRLVAQGWTNKRVGHALSLSERTVENHLRSIYQKLQISDRTQLVIYAIRAGIIPFSMTAGDSQYSHRPYADEHHLHTSS